MKHCSLPLALLLFALCSQSSIAHGEDVGANRVAARALAFEANAALENQDFAAAAERFARADALVHAPTLLLGLARADVGLGKLTTAHEVYARILREGVARGSPAVFLRAVEDAKSELAELELRMSTVAVDVKGPPDLRTKRDPDPDPAPSAASITSLRVTDAAKLAPPSPVRAASPRKTLGLVALGVGSAAIITGAVTGILALERESDLSAACPDDHCPPRAQSSVDTYSSLRIAAGSTLLAGAALAATGTLLILTTPKPRSGGAFIRPVLGAGHLSLEGAF